MVDVTDSDAFTHAVIERVTELVERGTLDASRWTVDGPNMPITNVQGRAAVYSAWVGETNIALRRFTPFPSRSNPDWLFTIEARREDIVIGHWVDDKPESALGRLVESVVKICDRTVVHERTAALGDLDVG